ncbi:hypothetical protein CDL12_16001 [Handroanthus impetiginosus]|uniref:Uncharacterized protein n=1 Tax=Handroanthus impetiginosus TaxID=429701 RepID=A0A2G9H1I2_9LAMI|nr:hypothetical protein CDL12_16001 [Handroanthus impetiginosus]
MASSSIGTYFTPHIRDQSRTLSWNPMPKYVTLKHTDQVYFQEKNFGLRLDDMRIRNFVVCANSVPPQAPVPSKPSSNSLINQIMRVLMAIVLPFLTNKFSPLWIFKNKIEDKVETVEQVANVVEEVAEQVDKVAEDVADDLPEGNLKNIVDFVDDVAEKAAESADSVEDFIDKVQEAEKQVESFAESLDDEAEESAKKKSSQN